MAVTLAFDIYGTLIDTQGIIPVLKKYAGNNAIEFSRIWRDKQLEYSFRRGLMQQFENFTRCTSDALDYTSALLKVPLGQQAKNELMAAYKTLAAFDDVAEGLAQAKKYGIRIFAFSNGSIDEVEALLVNAGIMDCFVGIVSAEEIKSYKPAPAIYDHLLRRTGGSKADTWLISSNSFDVIGAISFGMQAVWVRRSEHTLLDPWGIDPTLTVSSIRNLVEQLDLSSARNSLASNLQAMSFAAV